MWEEEDGQNTLFVGLHYDYRNKFDAINYCQCEVSHCYMRKVKSKMIQKGFFYAGLITVGLILLRHACSFFHVHILSLHL